MTRHSKYVMHDQVRELIPSIMKYDVTRETRQTETKLHFLAVAVVTAAYLFALAISG